MHKVNLADKLALFDAHWDPKVTPAGVPIGDPSTATSKSKI